MGNESASGQLSLTKISEAFMGKITWKNLQAFRTREDHHFYNAFFA